MAGSNVPTFGNWDSEEDVPYTIYFEKASKKRGGKITNPNDPQENPDMFPSKALPSDVAPNPVTAKPIALQYEEPPTTDKRRLSKDEGDYLNHQSSSPARSGNTVGQRRSESHPAKQSAGSFEKSPYHPQLHQEKSRERRSSHESSRATTPGRSYNNSNSHQGTPGRSYGTTPGRSRQKLESPDRGAAALPKFGDWDEKNPQSADNYSYIFNKVRDERLAVVTSNISRTPTRPPSSNSVNQEDDNKYQKSCCTWWKKR
ncbi:unnamed protein product [Cuscuta epithymum]|uniref:RIN4 pathogenic type III effector avirulence factor Avr cleavage site domain-containing protein n=1 Tax=Cuscuta epithymum TaxID=186058 RepID=A0AAV0FBV6_9ASTE|nr:unnamed protein product [Cuscuta epithymum]